MPNPRKVHVGQKLPRFPGNSFNAVVEHVLANRQRSLPPALAPPTAGTNDALRVTVQNKTGANLEELFSIVKLGDSIYQPDDIDDFSKVLRGLAFECDAPDADTGANFAVLQGPCRDDGLCQAVVSGLTWVKVDVQSESDTHATSIDGDDEKLTSGSSGALIKWKQTGTGIKWAVVLMGAATGGSDIGYGLLVADVPAQDWDVDVCRVESFSSTAGFTLELEDDEITPKLIAVWNRSYKALRGSTSFPVAISGPRLSFTYVDEAEVEQTTEIIIYTPYDLAEEVNFEESPANGKGQAVYHPHGTRVQRVDASPCGEA